MNPLYIAEPCSENWANMTPTQKGAFCASCAKEVIDFSTKTSGEITAILKQNLGKNMCGRIGKSQMEEFNQELIAWEKSRVQHMRVASYLALIAVFGMTLFSCQSPEAEHSIKQLQQSAFVRQVENTPEEVTEIELIEQVSTFEEEGDLMLGAISYSGKYCPDTEYAQMSEMEVVPRIERVMMMGAMVYTQIVKDYIEQIPLETAPRYDRNGLPIPEVHEDLVYPNPTNGLANYKLALPEEGIFVIGLYDMSGRHIRNMHEGELEAGTHTFELNLIDEQPGTFLVVCRSKNFSNTQRIIRF